MQFFAFNIDNRKILELDGVEQIFKKNSVDEIYRLYVIEEVF